MADDLINTLRNLANRWTMLARDYARASKEAGATEAQANYSRGYAEGYYKAATELAALLKEQSTAPQRPPQPRPAAPPQSPPPQGGGRRASSPTPPPQQQQRPAAPAQSAPPQQPKAAAPAAPVVTYTPVSVGEAINILVFAGCQPRDVVQNKDDNSLRATFSSWGSMMLHEQVTRVQTADPRIVILDSGKLESHDYFIDFAFK